MRRIFAAIDVSPGPRLLEFFPEAKAFFGYEKIRWVNPQQMHLTLKFFGETADPAIEEIRTAMRSVAGRYQPFEFILRGVGIFGSRYQPRVIWAGTQDDALLRNLAEEVLDAMAEIGFPRERLPFVPHLTLGRISSISNKKRLTDWVSENEKRELQMVSVSEVKLYESILKPTGAVYSVVESFRLLQEKS